jgi:hypothetical protein
VQLIIAGKTNEKPVTINSKISDNKTENINT